MYWYYVFMIIWDHISSQMLDMIVLWYGKLSSFTPFKGCVFCTYQNVPLVPTVITNIVTVSSYLIENIVIFDLLADPCDSHSVANSLVTFWREQEQCADSACCRDVSVWRTQISRVFPIQWFDFSINITKSRGLRIGGTSAKTHEELVAKGNTSLRCEGCTVIALVRIISYTTVSAKV